MGHDRLRHRLHGTAFRRLSAQLPGRFKDDEVDALAYSPQGFIWDNCLAQGKTLRDYGEFTITRKKWRDNARAGKPKFLDHYREFIARHRHIEMHSDPGVETLRPYMAAQYIGWDLDVPDVQRAATFIEELKGFERKREFSQSRHHRAAQRSYQRHGPRLPHPGGASGGQRFGVWADCGCPQSQPVLAGNLHPGH